MNRFRIFDKVEGKYSKKKFAIEQDGTLLTKSNVSGVYSPSDPDRYLVEWGTKNVFENDKVIWRCKGSIIEGEVVSISGELYVQDLKGGNTTRLIKCSSLKVIGTIHDINEV